MTHARLSSRVRMTSGLSFDTAALPDAARAPLRPAPRSTSGRRHRARWLGGALAVLALLGVLASCQRREVQPRPATLPSVPVHVAAVEIEGGSAPVIGTGVLAGKEEVALSFKTGGVVERARVESGQRVRAGEVLAELAQTEIVAEVEKATQGRDKAERDLARARSLYTDSVATLEQVQNATTALDVAASNLRIAEFNRRYTVIRAPFNGIVLKRGIEAGQLVSAGATAVVVRNERSGLVLRVGLADRDAVRVAVGDAATVRFNAWPGIRFEARVQRVAAGATAGAGTYEAELLVDPSGHALASGLIGEAEIRARSADRHAFVPVGALLEADGDSASVYVIAADGRSAHRRSVRVAFLDGSRVALSSGLDTLERVVTDGNTRILDGAAVRVMSPSEGRLPAWVPRRAP